MCSKQTDFKGHARHSIDDTWRGDARRFDSLTLHAVLVTPPSRRRQRCPVLTVPMAERSRNEGASAGRATREREREKTSTAFEDSIHCTTKPRTQECHTGQVSTLGQDTRTQTDTVSGRARQMALWRESADTWPGKQTLEGQVDVVVRNAHGVHQLKKD